MWLELFHIVCPLAICGLNSEEFSHITICSILSVEHSQSVFSGEGNWKLTWLGLKCDSEVWSETNLASAAAELTWASAEESINQLNRTNREELEHEQTRLPACSWLRSLIGFWLTMFSCVPLSECTHSYYFNRTLFVFLPSELFPPSSPRPSSPPHFILSLGLVSCYQTQFSLPYLVRVHILMLLSCFTTLLPPSLESHFPSTFSPSFIDSLPTRATFTYS